MTFAIIKAHPRSDDVVLVQMPSGTAKAILERPGRPDLFWDASRKAWRLATVNVDSLVQILRQIGVVFTDEREPDAPVSTGPARHRPLPECRSCQTPVRRGSTTAAYCAGCGAPVDVIELSVEDVTGARVTSECVRCRRTQPGAFPYCSTCGATMPPREEMTVRVPRVPASRPQLEDPVTVGELVEQLALPAGFTRGSERGEQSSSS